MKTIFRYTNAGLLLATVIALGAVTGFAQDPCTDADGQTVLSDKVRELFPKKDIESQKAKIDAGKQFLEKYGACDSAKEFSDYLKANITKWETAHADAKVKGEKDKLVARFNAGLTAKNWDELYSAGKELLTRWPDDFRDVQIALGMIGYDESFKGNFKYNEESLKFAKASIADLEAGKKFSAEYGVPKEFAFKSKDNAVGWLNFTIGYITQIAQKNKKDALPYLFKATQANSDTKKNPIPYELIGYYYFDELDKLTEEIKVLAADQKDTDTPEVAKQKVDAIKAKVALANGTAERAMDAFSRAFGLSQAQAYKAKMKTNVENAYKLRFAKTDGVDAWIAGVMAKPFPSPLTPVTPVTDPEPATTTSSAAPVSVAQPVAPAVVTVAPAVKVAKSQATFKKASAKRKGA